MSSLLCISWNGLSPCPYIEGQEVVDHLFCRRPPSEAWCSWSVGHAVRKGRVAKINSLKDTFHRLSSKAGAVGQFEGEVSTVSSQEQFRFSGERGWQKEESHPGKVAAGGAQCWRDEWDKSSIWILCTNCVTTLSIGLSIPLVDTGNHKSSHFSPACNHSR